MLYMKQRIMVEIRLSALSLNNLKKKINQL